MTINFQIGGHPEEFVQGQLDSGRYADATEVVLDALRQMEARQRETAEIGAKIAAGMASLRAGRHSDGEAFFDEMDAELDEIAKTQSRRGTV